MPLSIFYYSSLPDSIGMVTSFGTLTSKYRFTAFSDEQFIPKDNSNNVMAFITIFAKIFKH